MTINALGQFNIGGHKHGGPNDGVEAHNVFADDVCISGPEALKQFCFGVGIAKTGDVVGQRVEPNIHDVVCIAGHFDAPVEFGF